MRISREDAIKEVGLMNVASVEAGNVEFTNRVTEGTKDHGYVEFSASIDCKDMHGEEVTLTMYVFVDEDAVEEAEELDQIDWAEAMGKTAEYEII